MRIVKDIGREKIEYEIIFGGEKLVFLKGGADANLQGAENRYLKMARRIHKRLGATVICASNPDTPHEEFDEAQIRRVIAEKNMSEFEISLIGVSDGAYLTLSLAKQFPEAVKWVGINTSYPTIPKLKERLLSLSGLSKILIYGTDDIDLKEVIPAIRGLTTENLVLKLFDGADHGFTGMDEEFISLADCLN